MKGKTGIVVLVVLCIALGVGLLIRHAKAVQAQQDAEAKIMTLSNQWVKSEGDLNDQRKVNATLEKTLETKAAAQQAKDEIARRDAKIADLEGKNDDMTKQMTDLNTSISNLESQIAE